MDLVERIQEFLAEAKRQSKLTVKLPEKKDTMIMADQLSGYYGPRGQTKKPTDAMAYKVDIFPTNSKEVRVTISPPSSGGPAKVTPGMKQLVKDMILKWEL